VGHPPATLEPGVAQTTYSHESRRNRRVVRKGLGIRAAAFQGVGPEISDGPGKYAS
jgi:hypothetical protein